ncbi:MAG: hypothetical protein KDD04_05275, partial [Sinomicrobium sp.]|nr:hypothetical protein [Sinomicrobium sp.]
MALDTIIIDGDEVEFSTIATLTLIPGKPKTQIKATGKTTLNGKKVCVEGDEKNVEITNCSYTMPPFTVPGSGTLKIKQLVPNQLTQKAASGNKRIILQGKLFIAQFDVTSPAKQPPPANTP